MNRNDVVLNTEVGGQRLRVIETALRGIRRRHRDTSHILRAKCLHRERCRHRRIDPAAQANHRTAKAAFTEVIAHAQHQRIMQQRHGIRFPGRLRRPIQIHLHQRLGKMRAGRQRFTRAIQRQAASVKNQFIIAAHRIAINHGPLRLDRQTGQHFAPHRLLAEVPGRSGNIDNDLGALLHQCLNRIAAIPAIRPKGIIIPHILANRQAEPATVKFHRHIGFGRLKIAVFIKHIVRRQQRLRPGGHNLALMQQRHRIHRRSTRLPLIGGHMPNHQASALHRLRQRFQRSQIALNEPAL